MDQVREFDLSEKNELLGNELTETGHFSRREFLQTMAVGSGGAITFGAWLVETADAQAPRYGLVVVDFNKCTGCRTCEAVCSNANHTVSVNGQDVPDLGNPNIANVRILTFYPTVEIPNRCTQCDDAPCIASCPVPADPTTGRKALYRAENTQAVTVDYDRCIACGTCAKTCAEMRTGAILINSETRKPEGICTLCEGDPACVKYCPYGALSYVQGGIASRHYGFSPEVLAKQLTTLWYYEQD